MPYIFIRPAVFESWITVLPSHSRTLYVWIQWVAEEWWGLTLRDSRTQRIVKICYCSVPVINLVPTITTELGVHRQFRVTKFTAYHWSPPFWYILLKLFYWMMRTQLPHWCFIKLLFLQSIINLRKTVIVIRVRIQWRIGLLDIVTNFRQVCSLTTHFLAVKKATRIDNATTLKTFHVEGGSSPVPTIFNTPGF